MRVIGGDEVREWPDNDDGGGGDDGGGEGKVRLD